MQGRFPSATPDTDMQYRIAAKNVGTGDIGAYGIAEITDVKYDKMMGELYLEVQIPTTDNVKTIAIVTEAPIAAGAYGTVTVTYPGWVLYDPADGVPSLGQQWGPKKDTYKARLGKLGFLAIPLASGDNPPRANLATMMLEVCRS